MHIRMRQNANSFAKRQAPLLPGILNGLHGRVGHYRLGVLVLLNEIVP